LRIAEWKFNRDNPECFAQIAATPEDKRRKNGRISSGDPLGNPQSAFINSAEDLFQIPA
jgi:hypothetical protein